MRLSLPLLLAILPLMHADADDVPVPPDTVIPMDAGDFVCKTRTGKQPVHPTTQFMDMENKGMCKFFLDKKPDLSTCHKACRVELDNEAVGCRAITVTGFPDENGHCFWKGSCMCSQGYKKRNEHEVKKRLFSHPGELSASASAGPFICGETRVCGQGRCLGRPAQLQPQRPKLNRTKDRIQASQIERRVAGVGALDAIPAGEEESYVLSVVQRSYGDHELEHESPNLYAVSKHGEFKDSPFPVFVKGLQGCIGISIVSQNGYWMGYFKESAFFPEPSREKQWDSLLHAVTQGTANYTRPSTLGDLFGVGSNPEIFVAQPRSQIDKAKMYDVQVATLLKEIQKDVLQSAIVHLLSYVKPESVEEVENTYKGTARGIMLIEYDCGDYPPEEDYVEDRHREMSAALSTDPADLELDDYEEFKSARIGARDGEEEPEVIGNIIVGDVADPDESYPEDPYQQIAMVRVFLEGFAVEKSWNATEAQELFPE